MKRLARFLARLYPQPWRARYGAEFDVLLEDANLTCHDLLDLTTAVLMARLQPRTTHFPSKGDDAMDTPETILRVIELNDRDIPHGYELESVLESTNADGSRITTRQFFRELDFGDSYVTIHHWARGLEPARTFVVSGTKGEVAGDFRTDQTEMTILNADGSLRRTEQTVKTWMKAESIRQRLRERYREGLRTGLSPDQVFQALRLENESRAKA